MSKTLIYPKGSAILFTTGEYSDYRINAMLIADKELDLPALAQAYVDERRKAFKPEDDRDHFDQYDAPCDLFPSWLVAKGWASPRPKEEAVVHLGDYNAFEANFGVRYQGANT